MAKAQTSLPIRILLLIFLVYRILPAMGQNCEVDFPGTAIRSFSSSCGSSTSNLVLGKNTYFGDGDIFTFDLPVNNVGGNIHLNALGSGKIVIPAGVTVNVDGNFHLDAQSSGCSSANPCVFEVEVNGTLNISNNFHNNLMTLVWSGTGTVVVDADFKNSNKGCMACGAGGCPSFQFDPSDCEDDGAACPVGDFCTQMNSCTSDVTPPVITGCPSNQVVNMTGPGCTQAISWTAPSATDNCNLSSLIPSRSPGAFPKGLTTVSYTATDAAGNTATCSFNVNVVDNVAPVITGCPANITVNANASCQALANWTAPDFIDNCAGTTMASSKAPGSTFNVGLTTVIYTATDAAGNAATCSFTVTVKDVTPPVIMGHADVVEPAGPSCTAKVNFSTPTIEDCDAVIVSSSHQPGDEFPLGITEVMYTATDISGNASTHKFNVIVEDQSGPVFQNCAADIIVNANSTCSAVVDWGLPSVTDNCGGVTISSSHNPGETFPTGTTEVLYTAKDNNGNVSTCTFKVTVKNEMAPIISSCPNDIALKGNEAGMASAEWTEPTAAAQCGEVRMTSSHQPGDLFKIGTTKIEYKVTDNAGIASYCYFNVIVSQTDIEIDVGKFLTPDGNGVNDAWILTNIEKFPNNKVVIVDRWGGLIFTNTGYDNENVVWRGTNRAGDLVPTGTYFYTVSVRFGPDKVEKSGFIELVR